MAEDAWNEDAAHNDTVPQTLEASGQAAILLVESLIHSLISKSVISVAEAVEIVAIAAEVTTEIAEDLGGPLTPERTSHTILSAIAKSLNHDIP